MLNLNRPVRKKTRSSIKDRLNPLVDLFILDEWLILNVPKSFLRFPHGDMVSGNHAGGDIRKQEKDGLHLRILLSRSGLMLAIVSLSVIGRGVVTSDVLVLVIGSVLALFGIFLWTCLRTTQKVDSPGPKRKQLAS